MFPPSAAGYAQLMLAAFGGPLWIMVGR